MKKVFLIFVELAAASEKFERYGYAGGFVTVVVPADDIRAAIDAGEKALCDDGYEVAEIDKALLFEPEEWEHDVEVLLAARQSAEDNETRYTPFEVWGH